jgi:hypothetical protein
MSENNTINWNEALRPVNTKLALNEAEIGVEYPVLFEEVKLLDEGAIVATVDCEELEGNTLWLRSAKYGAQNGLASLLKACDGDGDKIEGGTFTYTRVESDKSPTGWAHRWTV